MLPVRFKHVCIESMAVVLPPNEVTSAELEDRIAPLYERLEIPFGTLEKLSGVKSRRLWDARALPSVAATEAAKSAIENSGSVGREIRAIINTSVARDFFEPATACIIHRNLNLPENAMAFDVTNACIGFSNGMLILGNLIESGAIKAGVVVSCETVAPIIESTIHQLRTNQSIGREELLKILPTFTLGSGAVAYVLCHESVSANGHRLIGAVSRSATEHSDLCSGNGDYHMSGEYGFTPMMYTESAKLMAAASKLGGRMFQDFTQSFGWSRQDVDHIFCHQVGKQVNENFYREMGLDIEKEFTVYRNLGNLVSAALPTAVAMGSEQKSMQQNEKVLLTAFGSGLNSIFLGVVW